MRQELDDKLVAKYPLIFKNRNGDMRTTCMCWGFEHGDGWYDLLDTLCGLIQWRIDNPPSHWDPETKKSVPHPVAQVVADQVKEKFGSLRFYYSGGDNFIDGMVDMAEAMSGKICEDCGKPGHQNDSGWISTLCDECRQKRRQR